MAGQPGRSGGARSGAGRKPKSVQFSRQIQRGNKAIADDYETYLETMKRLAAGGYERVEQKQLPAGMVLVDDYADIVDEEGEPTGKTRKIKRLAFPDLNPTEMITVERKVSWADGDRLANQYLIDRIAGKPVGEDEAENYQIVVDEIIARFLEAIEGADPEIREQVKASLKGH